MDHRLERVDTLMAGVDEAPGSSAAEFSFAIRAIDENDPATLRWLAATAAVRADDLENMSR